LRLSSGSAFAHARFCGHPPQAARDPVLVSASFIAAFWKLISAYFEVYTTTGNQAETLTGRVGVGNMFGKITRAALDRAWLSLLPQCHTELRPFEPWHAHNELLQLFYAYGAVGIFLFFVVYGSLFLQIRRLPILL